MEDKTFLTLSFAATIAYGLLALAALLVAGLVLGSTPSVVCALLAIGAAYLAQSFATNGLAVHALQRAAMVLQLVSCGLFLVGLFFL